VLSIIVTSGAGSSLVVGELGGRPGRRADGVTNLVGEHAVAQLVKALRYKPEGREFDSRWCHWNFSLI
jgi:hypothetical protein